MASTYSTNLKIELIASGSQAGTWGDTTNVNLGTALEEAITGRAAVEFGSDANLTLTAVDLNTTQLFRNLLLDVTSVVSLTAARDLIVPTITKQYVVWNNTTGGQAITVRTSGGTGVSVPNGARAHLFVDGTDVEHAITFVNGTVVPADDTLVTPSATQTLTNKTFNLSSNTLTGTLAEFNTALSDGSFASLAGTETLTNKTFNLSSNTLTGTLAQFNTALSDGSFASLAGTETLTNKTLTAPAISDPTGIDADDIDYDNTTSGLTATDVQAAIDEVSQADGISYDNTTSGLTATDVQGAIDEAAESGAGATGGGTDQVFFQNDQVVTTSYSIPSDKNAMTTGPIEIEDGATVTVPSGSRWVVI